MYPLFRFAFACSLLFFSAFVSSDDRFEVSGFARVVAGYLDEDSATYEGYKDSISLSQQSLFGLQGEFYINEKLTLATQALAHSGEQRQSGIEWFYLNYEPNQYLRFKVGKLRTPFFQYSDIIDVGFAFSWITPPQQVYSGVLFSNYEGATVTFRQSTDLFNFDIEGYWGVYDDEVFVSGREIDVDVDQILGTIVQVHADRWSFRAAFSRSDDFDALLPELERFAVVLEQAGFQRNADSLRFNGSVNAYQLSINYDDLDYFGRAEWARITSDVLVIPTINSYYISAGYNFYPFQIHATFARSDVEYDDPVNEIPVGIAPELDRLAFGYDALVSDLPVDNLDSLTLGLRWDFRPRMALKADVTFLDGDRGDRAFFDIKDDVNFDRRANLYQIGWEWIF